MLGVTPITTHIPNKGEQLVRYSGFYSNVSRGKRKKEEHKKDVIGKPEFVEVLPPTVSKELTMPGPTSSQRSMKQTR